MFCKNCGSELSDGSAFCARCGFKQDDAPGSMAVVISRQRHGFTTFWLWFCLIVSGISGLISLFTENTALMGVILLVDAVSYFMLLQWKKLGFYLGVIIGVIQMIIAPGQDNLMEMLEMGINPVMVNLVALIMSIGLLFWILNFKSRTGRSTWSQLEKFS